MKQAKRRHVTLAMTGASGAIFGVRALEILSAQTDVVTHLIVSRAARQTLSLELDRKIGELEVLADHVHAPDDIGACISSGSFRMQGMLIAPCSVKTMSNIANGNVGDLISRAADVMLKERGRLVVAIRETPLHEAHLQSLAKLSRLGATIFPPVPAFYIRPASIQELVDHSVMRMLDQLGIELDLTRRWDPDARSSPGNRPVAPATPAILNFPKETE